MLLYFHLFLSEVQFDNITCSVNLKYNTFDGMTARKYRNAVSFTLDLAVSLEYIKLRLERTTKYVDGILVEFEVQYFIILFLWV